MLCVVVFCSTVCPRVRECEEAAPGAEALEGEMAELDRLELARVLDEEDNADSMQVCDGLDACLLDLVDVDDTNSDFELPGPAGSNGPNATVAASGPHRRLLQRSASNASHASLSRLPRNLHEGHMFAASSQGRAVGNAEVLHNIALRSILVMPKDAQERLFRNTTHGGVKHVATMHSGSGKVISDYSAVLRAIKTITGCPRERLMRIRVRFACEVCPWRQHYLLSPTDNEGMDMTLPEFVFSERSLAWSCLSRSHACAFLMFLTQCPCIIQQDCADLRKSVAWDVASESRKMVPNDVDEAYDGSPCLGFSSLLGLAKRKANAYCVRNGTGASGAGAQNSICAVHQLGIPIHWNENVASPVAKYQMKVMEEGN